MVDDENKYDEMSESVDIMGNVTKYDRDDNGNVTKTTNPDGTFTLANYNSKNNVTPTRTPPLFPVVKNKKTLKQKE